MKFLGEAEIEGLEATFRFSKKVTWKSAISLYGYIIFILRMATLAISISYLRGWHEIFWKLF